MTKVDRRILKTREAINKAFIELLAEKSFNDITINAIAERANINRGTLYLHFTDKYDLMDQAIESNLKTFTGSCVVKKAEQGASVNDMANSLLPIFEYFEKNYLFYSTMLVNRGDQCFREHLLQVVIKGTNESLGEDINHELNKEITAQYMSAAFVGIVEWWLKNEMPLSPLEMARHMCVLIQKNL